MSLNKINFSTLIQKQFKYKLNIHTGMFSSLVIVQVLALLLSVLSPTFGYSSMNGMEMEVRHFNHYNVIIFTSLWALIHSVMMTAKKDWEHGFPFVGNSISNDLSNMLFLLAASILAGITTVLSGFVVRVYVYYFTDQTLYMSPDFLLTVEDIVSGMLAMIFHLFLMCAIGYFLGTVSRLHRLLPILLPVVIIGFLIGFAQMNAEIIQEFYEFYYEENNAFIYCIKILVTVIILSLGAMAISGRMEVRK